MKRGRGGVGYKTQTTGCLGEVLLGVGVLFTMVDVWNCLRSRRTGVVDVEKRGCDTKNIANESEIDRQCERNFYYYVSAESPSVHSLVMLAAMKMLTESYRAPSSFASM